MSASDFIELVLTAALIAMALVGWRWRIAERTRLCMAVLAALPIVLRVMLIARHPIPTPDIYDEFGHLLVADTLRHWRLANPAHSLHQFFETFFVLQDPTYSSIYPIGQGLMLAIGKALFGDPWAGVLLSTGALCALCYWMLRAWVAPNWALAGGLIAVFEFGPLSQWMNGYWGGSFAAAGGCLVFGALPRLAERNRTWLAVALGAGIAINLITRPYETIFLVIAVAVYAIAKRIPARALLIAAIVILPAIGITLLQNKRVTGSWTMLPYQLSQFQYGVPAALTFQPDPTPHSVLTVQQQMEYKAQMGFRGADRETITNYLLRLEYRVRFYRFFFLPPLFLALPFFLLRLRERRYAWVAATLLLFALGINFFPAFQLHYLAGVTCLFVLMSVAGLERLSRINADGARLLMALCIVYFGFWFTIHLFDGSEFSVAMRPYETWNGLNHQNPGRRILVKDALDQIPGKLLVIVRYTPRHVFQDEWVYNDADIDGAHIVWARDLGSANAALLAHYPDRTVLLLEPDERVPRLAAYGE